MLIIKRITIIFSLLAGLVLIGHFLPMTLNVTPKKLLSNYSYRGQRLSKPKSVNPEIKDTTDYLSLLQQSLNVTKVKKNSHSLTWLVSNGIDLPVHAVNLSSALKSLHCQLTNAVENNRKPAELSTQFICPDKKTYAVTLRIGDNYSDAIAQLSIIFKADNTISIENMQRLDELNIPYTLIVDPYEESQTIYYDIKRR